MKIISILPFLFLFFLTVAFDEDRLWHPTQFIQTDIDYSNVDYSQENDYTSSSSIEYSSGEYQESEYAEKDYVDYSDEYNEEYQEHEGGLPRPIAPIETSSSTPSASSSTHHEDLPQPSPCPRLPEPYFQFFYNPSQKKHVVIGGDITNEPHPTILTGPNGFQNGMVFDKRSRLGVYAGLSQRGYTIDVWIKLPLPDFGYIYHTLISSVVVKNNILGSLFWSGDNSEEKFHPTNINLSNFRAGWHKLTVVGLEGRQSFYIDGVFKGSNNVICAKRIHNIGNMVDGHSPFGAMADLAIYSEPLFKCQIRQMIANQAECVVPSQAVLTVTTRESVIDVAGSHFTTVGTYSHVPGPYGLNTGLMPHNKNSFIMLSEMGISLGAAWTMDVWILLPLPANSVPNQQNIGAEHTFTNRLRILARSIDEKISFIATKNNILGSIADGEFKSANINLDHSTPGWHKLTVVHVDNRNIFYIDGKQSGHCDFHVSRTKVKVIGNAGETIDSLPATHFLTNSDHTEVYSWGSFSHLRIFRTSFLPCQVQQTQHNALCVVPPPFFKVEANEVNHRIIVSGSDFSLSHNQPVVINSPSTGLEASISIIGEQAISLGTGAHLGNAYTLDVWILLPLPRWNENQDLKLAGNHRHWHTLVASDNSDQIVVVDEEGLNVGSFIGNIRSFQPAGFHLRGLPNGWHRLTVIAEGGTQRFFLNGHLKGLNRAQSYSPIKTIGNVAAGQQQPFGTFRRLRLYHNSLPICAREHLWNSYENHISSLSSPTDITRIAIHRFQERPNWDYQDLGDGGQDSGANTLFSSTLFFILSICLFFII